MFQPRSSTQERAQSVLRDTTLIREKTPLFLPEDDERERSQTPAPFRKVYPPVPLFDDPDVEGDEDDEEGYGGMMQFSQALSAVGDSRAGAAEDEEETDTAGLYVMGEEEL
jgi:hypothetical protein